MAESHLTPMFRQIRALKQRYPDVLLMIRMGDFYEMFEADAEVAAEALELKLTSRELGRGRRVPMCGIPYHALDRYVARLLKRGLRAAICEQVEDPKEAKGLVKRDVVRVLTPGTLTEDSLLDAAANNYLVALADRPGQFALAAADLSTGEFQATEFTGERAEAALLEELGRLQPAEVLWPLTMQSPTLRSEVERVTGLEPTVVEPGGDQVHSSAERLRRHFEVVDLRGFGLTDNSLVVEAAATALKYIQDTQFAVARHITSLATYTTGHYMTLDAATRRNLELIVTLREGRPGQGTLLWLLDDTCTPMGARLLRGWLVRPLTAPEPIRRRLDAVAALHDDLLRRDDIRAELHRIGDLERLVARAATGRALPRDVALLRDSLVHLPALKAHLADCPATRLTELAAEIQDLSGLSDLLARALVDDPPAKLAEGHVIRAGYHAELDELRSTASHGKEWVARLEAEEREKTGIGSLKIGYNQVFGYYLEVTRSNLALVPERYIRKQTLANAERYISPELKDWEARILGAEERLQTLEQQLFAELRSTIAAHAEPILRSARALAEIDLYAALAHVAAERGYTRPEVDGSQTLRIVGGRHPIVEAVQTSQPFVPNDTELDTDTSQIHILTGPNMAGKSTYLRQVALITLLAQLGSFVPATQAQIGCVDRIFTRVGAQDDLATGQSTFMVEMSETANILHNATRRSLVVLDEIGRGTSTFDGLSIAWAVVEFLHDDRNLGCKTLFATHYHDLNELAERLERVRNYRVAVAEEKERVRFLHRIEPGGTDRSYGVEVARLAGLPAWVIRRAREILHTLEQRGEQRGEIPEASWPEAVQLALFGETGPHPVLAELRRLDVMRLTPIEAINKLFELHQRASRDE